MQEKLIIQLDHFCFSIFSDQIAKTVDSKINDSGRLRTPKFSSSRFGVRVTALPKIFEIYPLHFSIAEISETIRGSATKIFDTVRQKNFDRES